MSVTTADVTVENHGSIFLFRPMNDAARQHLEENVSDGAQWFGGALAVEPRYAGALAQALIEDGMEVE
jgi:hypothetical protein